MSDEQMTERQDLVREFPVELSEGDGRTIEAKIVPYNTTAVVADAPDFVQYREEWLPGAFERQTSAPQRVKVWLNFEHTKGLPGIVGHGVDLQEAGDHLRGVFRVHENADGDKALQLVREGLLTGLSLEAVALSSRKTAAGVVQRIRAHLDGVALCRFPAFKDAQVVAVREEPAVIVPAADLQPIENTALVQRLEALGAAPLQRVKISRQPWNSDEARFDTEQFAASCLIDRGDAAKDRYAVPVLEPDGQLNVNALPVAAGRLPVVDAGAEAKRAAARKLVRYYRIAGMEAPRVIARLAYQ